MKTYKYNHNDGGRLASGFKGKSGDCAIRAMAIACCIPYNEARSRCKDASAVGRLGSRATARGMYKEDFTAALSKLGWRWFSAPKFEGRKARGTDMPSGRVIARMSRHYAAVINGVVNDSWDSSEKMVYGYWGQDT
jgi:hypothetical protein